MQSSNQDDHPPDFHVYEPCYLPWQPGPQGQQGRSRWMLFEPIIQDSIPTKMMCVCLCVCVCARAHLCVLMSACVWCLSNPHLPRLFQGYHSDRCNHQWQPWLQLRAGISIPSQPIRDEMLGNREGQAKPYEGIPVHKHTYLQT